MAEANTSRDLESLRAEVERLSELVKAQASAGVEDVRRRATYAANAAAPVARQAVDVAKAEGNALAQTAREHPTATSGVLLVTAALGLAVGYVLGAASQVEPPRRRYW